MPPPYRAARYGNLQILPSPTEAPAADRMKPILFENVLLFLCSIHISPLTKRHSDIGTKIPYRSIFASLKDAAGFVNRILPLILFV